MRDKGWTILSVGVNRANQHDLMELGGDSGNAFYIEKGCFYNTDIIHVINRVGNFFDPSYERYYSLQRVYNYEHLILETVIQSIGLKRLIPAIIHRLHEIEQQRVKQEKRLRFLIPTN